MLCPICKTREINPDDESCCIECDRIDDFIRSTPKSAASNGRAVVAESVTVQGCIDCQTKAAVCDGRCLQCDRKFRDKQQEATIKVPTTNTRNLGQTCDECSEPAFCKGKCPTHYQKMRRDIKAQRNGVASAPAPTPRKSRAAKKPAESNAAAYLQQRAKEKYDQALAAAEAEYKKMLDAIEIVKDLSREFGE